jgi:hypothetical protein
VVRQDRHRNRGRAGNGKEPARCQLSGRQRALPATAVGSIPILDEAERSCTPRACPFGQTLFANLCLPFLCVSKSGWLRETNLIYRGHFS